MRQVEASVSPSEGKDAGMTDDRVTISIDGGVADVRMNRPEKINALDNAQFAAIVDAGESLKKEPAVRQRPGLLRRARLR